MLSLAEASSTDSSPLSLRLSCDRCRAQKLKCSVPDGSGACQRCTRARISCVFGRRSSSRRTNRRIEQMAAQTPKLQSRPDPAPVTPISPAPPPRPSRFAAASASASTSPTPAPEAQLEVPIDPKLSSYDVQMIWDSFEPNVSECGNELTGYDWSQPGFVLNEKDIFEAELFDLTMSSQIATLTDTTSWPLEGIAAASNMGSSVKDTNAVLTGQRLTALVADIQQELRKLKEGPWHTDSACSLSDYPVGTIFELSQQFSAVAGPIISSTIFAGGTLEGEEDAAKVGDEKMNEKKRDTPTMLLVMCGYMWLVSIYDVMLEHFQKHLHRMPHNHKRTHHLGSTVGAGATSTCPANTALRLGDLPCADTALSLQQIHTAVCMLFDVLHDIEGHLGREAMVARNMAVTLLLNSGRRQAGSSGDLGNKATAVRELLREKMGL